jgi:homoserine dehydrogenase
MIKDFGSKTSFRTLDTALGGLVLILSSIYESYGDRPIVIQGAGAGSAVTTRGVLEIF